MKMFPSLNRSARKKSRRSRQLMGRRNRLLRAEAMEARRLLAASVVPGGLENTEGNTNNLIPFQEPDMRYQQVYAASDFSKSIVINEIAFRPDWSFTPEFSNVTISGLEVVLSSTDASPSTLSSTFSDNVGADVQQVFDGDWTVSTARSGPAQGPLDFDIVLTLDTPFNYDPAEGNLLMEVRNPAPNPGFVELGAWDADRFNHSMGRLFASSVDASTGIATNNYGLATKFVGLASNSEPLAVDDAYEVDEDKTLAANAADGVLGNDSDPDGDSLTATPVVTGPSNGTVTLGADGSFEYTPTPDFHGQDSFVYEVSDGNGGTDTATVNVTVDPVADIVDDSDTIDEDTSSNLDVLANDAFADASASVTGVSQGANGGVIIEPDGTVTYTPDTDFHGSDSFTYTVTTATGSVSNQETATVDITVNSVIDAQVDVKPGSSQNPINLNSKGVLPVAVLSTQKDNGELEDFDATTIDTDTIGLNGMAVDPFHAAFEDVDGDGDLDLMLHFRMQDLVDDDTESVFDETSVDLALTAEYAGGDALGADVRGSDSVRIVPSNGKGKGGK